MIDITKPIESVSDTNPMESYVVKLNNGNYLVTYKSYINEYWLANEYSERQFNEYFRNKLVEKEIVRWANIYSDGGIDIWSSEATAKNNVEKCSVAVAVKITGKYQGVPD